MGRRVAVASSQVRTIALIAPRVYHVCPRYPAGMAACGHFEWSASGVVMLELLLLALIGAGATAFLDTSASEGDDPAPENTDDAAHPAPAAV